jgi:hypothetical protein
MSESESPEQQQHLQDGSMAPVDVPAAPPMNQVVIPQDAPRPPPFRAQLYDTYHEATQRNLPALIVATHPLPAIAMPQGFVGNILPGANLEITRVGGVYAQLFDGTQAYQVLLQHGKDCTTPSPHLLQHVWLGDDKVPPVVKVPLPRTRALGEYHNWPHEYQIEDVRTICFDTMTKSLDGRDLFLEKNTMIDVLKVYQDSSKSPPNPLLSS